MEIKQLYDQLISTPFLIAGPCVIEGETMILRHAEKLKKLTEEAGIPYIFKASFDKANRTSIKSSRGPGLEEGLRILQKVKEQFELPLTTDVHETYQIPSVSDVIDVIQIPAFLCRQTDLLVAAASTGKIVNIKKGQFLSGKDMQFPAQKVKDSGNDKIFLTERGSMFGYGNLEVDFRNIVDMKALGYPVVMDVTHSTQKPGGLDGKSGGNREYAPYLAMAAKAVGVDGFFFETHEDPSSALSDGPNMIPLNDFQELIRKVFR